jgi:phospholipid/cholesterol/gamma-HCH transport system substrate-binding protein
MENRSPYILVGAAVILFVLGVLGFLIWKLGAGDRTSYAYYEIFFGGEVQGLGEDSPVFYRGLKVGRVHSITLASRREVRQRDGREREVEKIRVTVAIDRKIDIREKSYAVFERPFIAGSAYVQVVGRLEIDDVKPKKLLGEKPYPEIREGASFLAAAQVSVQDLMAKIGNTVERLNAVLSEDNVKAVSAVLDNIEKATGALGNQAGSIEKTLSEMPALVADLRTTATDIRQAIQGFDKVAANINLLLEDVGPQDEATRKALAGRSPSELRQTLQSMRVSLAKIDAAAGNMAQLVNENRKPIRQFTDTGLVELSQMIKEVRTLTTSLNIIAGKLERDPAGYIFSGKQGYTPR